MLYKIRCLFFKRDRDIAGARVDIDDFCAVGEIIHIAVAGRGVIGKGVVVLSSF